MKEVMKVKKRNGNKRRLALGIFCGCLLVLSCVFVAYAGNGPTTAEKKIVKIQKTPSKAKTAKHKKIGKEEVKAIQKALNSKGFRLVIDGVIGKHTRTAIKIFQKRNGLKVTGRPDKQTLARLGVK